MEETLFDFKENSELEPYDILNKVINFSETEFDKEYKNVIHIYMKYTAHDNLPYTESKLVVRQLKDSEVGKFLYYGFLGIIRNEFEKYLELVVDTEE